VSSAEGVSQGNPRTAMWFERRWVRALCGVVGVGLLLFSVPGPLTLTFLSVSSLGCLPGTACETWSAITLPLGGICVVLAIAGGLVGVIQAARPRRGLVIAQIALIAGTALTMLGLLFAAQAASAGRAQAASAQRTADAVVVAGDAALREALGFHPLWEIDPQGRVSGTGPEQQFVACDLGSDVGYRASVGYALTGLDQDQTATLSALAPMVLPDGALAEVSLTQGSDGSVIWQVLSECQPLPAG